MEFRKKKKNLKFRKKSGILGFDNLQKLLHFFSYKIEEDDRKK